MSAQHKTGKRKQSRKEKQPPVSRGKEIIKIAEELQKNKNTLKSRNWFPENTKLIDSWAN